jgi:hypothetical protein
MPLIHDVSTDADNPPQFLLLATLREQCKNGVAYSGLTGEAHHRRYPDLQPVLFKRPPLEVFYAAYDLVIARKWFLMNARKWRFHENDSGGEQIEGHIEATASTRILRFKDDIVIRLLAHGEQHQHTRLDMRSASRVGKSDLGANAKRLRDFLRDLKSIIKSNT